MEEGGENKFRACRIPHEEAYQMVAGLDIASRPLWMRAGPQEDGV
jgi:hypothetical protein